MLASLWIVKLAMFLMEFQTFWKLTFNIFVLCSTTSTATLQQPDSSFTGLSFALLGGSAWAPWALLGSPGLSGALLCSPGLSWALLGAPGISWALLGSPLSWALLSSPVLSGALVGTPVS